MSGSHRLLPLLLILALGAVTGCTAVGYTMGSGVSDGGGDRSGWTHAAFGSDEALQSPSAAQAADTTTGIRDTSVATSPTTDTADTQRGANRTLVVIAALAVVAGFIFLVAR